MNFSYRYRKAISIVALTALILASTVTPATAEYIPNLGRFAQRDPNGTGLVLTPGLRYHGSNPMVTVSMAYELQYGDGMNFYEYLRSNSINRNDPSGLRSDMSFSDEAYNFGFEIIAEQRAGFGWISQGLNRGFDIVKSTLYAGASLAPGLGNAIALYEAYNVAQNNDGDWRLSDWLTVLGAGTVGGLAVFKLAKATSGYIRARGAIKQGSQLANALGDGVGIARSQIARLGICFVAGTDVIMDDGSSKSIEQIQANDKVQCSLDPQATDEADVCVVSRTFSKKTDVIVDVVLNVDSRRITVSSTPEHPFYSTAASTYVPASELEPGALLRNVNGSSIDVISKRTRHGSFDVYNFEVAKAHNYFVSTAKVLVHNNCARLRLLHSRSTLRKSSLDFWGKKSTQEIVDSLKMDSTYGALLVKPNGTVMNGNTRLYLLRQRGVNIDALPRIPYP